MAGRTEQLYSIGFDPTGRYFFTGGKYSTAVWDAATYRNISFFSHPSLTGVADISPDGTRIVTSTIGAGPVVVGRLVASSS